MTDLANDLPPPEENLPAPPDADVDSWDVMGAAWKAETIRTDAWNYTQDKRRGLATEMYGMLGSEAKMRIANRRWDYENNWVDFEDMVLDEVSREVPTNPTKYGNLPLSREQFDQRIDSERKAEFEEAQGILDQPGGGFAEFLGSSARAMTDQTSLMLMPFGISGGALRTIAGEALLGAAGEAAVLPREFQVADELDLPKPDALGRIGMGALLGGGLSAGLIGLVKGVGMITARRRGALDARPPGVDPLDAEIRVDAAEAALRGDPTVQETIGPQPQLEVQSPAGPIQFDYRPAGNASPRTNRVGYVYGKFIELGYDPHVAAGLVGNFMVESGPSLRSDAVGDGGAAYGIAQWNDRRKDLEAFARKRGTSPNDLDTQIAFVDHELKTTEAGAWSKISQAKDAREAAILVSKYYERPGIPHNERRAGYAVSLQRQYEAGAVPKHDGLAVSSEPADYVPTSRGYTGQGQVTAGDDFRIDVDYEVLDISALRAASGDFQPRDRTRVASDAWIADTAAQLDPLRLMPAPTADRGAPIVGPDGMVESGNGRVAAIARAYDQFPDRSSAYRSQIEAAGYTIPEGVERPVLVARRRTPLDDEQLRWFVVEAQDSGVAQMTPTEVARASSRAMTAPVLMRLDPTQPLTHAVNGEFIKAALSGLPRSARNAMFGAGGILNSQGLRQLREALFARAWPDPEILARFTETDAGPLKSLLEALDRAAPSWAALRADIEAGTVRPEMDISPFVLDAMRLIGAARELAGREGLSIARAVAELLDEVDLLEGPVAPLTASLVRKFWRDGKAASADDVAGFLSRYADEARKAGGTGAMFDGPGPADVLKAIDPGTFKELPEEIGRPRGAAAELRAEPVDEGYDLGAQSPEAEETDLEIAAEIRAPAIVARETPSFYVDRPVDQAVELVTHDNTTIRSFGLVETEEPFEFHEVTLPSGQRLTVGIEKRGSVLRIVNIENINGGLGAQAFNSVGPSALRKVLAAYQALDPEIRAISGERIGGARRGGAWSMRAGQEVVVPLRGASVLAADLPTPSPTRRGAKTLDPLANRDVATSHALADAKAEFADLAIDMPDGTTRTAAEILDDLDQDAQFDAFVQACAIEAQGAAT